MATKRKTMSEIEVDKIPEKDSKAVILDDDLSNVNTPIYAYAIPIATGYIFGFVMEKGRGL